MLMPSMVGSDSKQFRKPQQIRTTAIVGPRSVEVLKQPAWSFDADQVLRCQPSIARFLDEFIRMMKVCRGEISAISTAYDAGRSPRLHWPFPQKRDRYLGLERRLGARSRNDCKRRHR